jgi:hypothetical protein
MMCDICKEPFARDALTLVIPLSQALVTCGATCSGCRKRLGGTNRGTAPGRQNPLESENLSGRDRAFSPHCPEKGMNLSHN